ncbi:multimeric flavodoxin WrbA [Catenibacillus scindens]|uniref:Multimeric flavodoxin WrbA n=1 Tax=Catenibacillus scindens TaxID=673271 RepID=A0A7W8H9I0_9FIRM|nr:flavodoxin family protein [Catenibacillus scindens]MBB5263943.1 multimeric flavodoxin WrbA [Catenibacillus scindens]
MKVLGISFGRKGRCSDILTKEALFEAKRCGADVEFINVIDLNIGHCTACDACSKAKERGMQIKCFKKDDYHILEEKVLDADGIVLAAPVYAVAPVGQLKNFIDRFGPAHDRAALNKEQERRKKEGMEPLDARYFKDRPIAYISVGGAITQNWVSMGLPIMHLFGISLKMKSVGRLDAYDMGRTASPVLDEKLMARAAALGRSVAENLGKPLEEMTFAGDDGCCPVCHNNLLTFTGTTTVECPICGIKGQVTVDGDKMNVTFSEYEQNRARGTENGLIEHCEEIASMIPIAIKKLEENKDRLPKLLEKYEHFEETIANM